RETVVAGAIGDGMDYQGYTVTEQHLDAIMDFIRLQKPPPSPFSPEKAADDPYHIDHAAVDLGKAVYQAHCAACHDASGARYRTIIPAMEIGTDRHRIDMWTEAAKE